MQNQTMFLSTGPLDQPSNSPSNQSSIHPSDPRGSSPKGRLTFREAKSKVAEQLEYPRTFDVFEVEAFKELLMIIAEVYLMPPDKPIRISGEWLDGYVVQEIFREIRGDHLRSVYYDYTHRENETPIANKKAYLRTMLYNAVFSAETHNEVSGSLL